MKKIAMEIYQQEVNMYNVLVLSFFAIHYM